MNLPWIWIGFTLFVLAMLALDLGVFHRHAHIVKVKEALIWSGIWIALALTFNTGVYFWFGAESALEFFTGYLIEKTLSVDNIFVFVLIFAAFGVPALYQHRILYWGVLGALVMRAALILLGVTLIKQFHWVIYLFGGFLIFTGIKMALQRHQETHPENNPFVRTAQRILPLARDYQGERFFVKQAGRWLGTPLLLVLIAVEFTDLIFAVDSIPAVFAVTDDAFIVYTSNVFAILGLRSLYFALAGIIEKFYYLKLGLSVVLVFVGSKMLLSEIYKIPITLSLSIVAVILGISLIASWMRARQLDTRTPSST